MSSSLLSQGDASDRLDNVDNGTASCGGTPRVTGAASSRAAPGEVERDVNDDAEARGKGTRPGELRLDNDLTAHRRTRGMPF
ncbi:unnamed protein product [Lampetra planeri]